MPNWCNNRLTLSHPDPAMMQRALVGFNANAFLGEFLPIPESLKITAGRAGADDSPEQIQLVAAEAANLEHHGFKNWYDWCCVKWGTKWDFGPDNPPTRLDDDGVLRVGFESAWTPPMAGYAFLTTLGFDVLAYYYEPGNGFCGRFTNEGPQYYRIDGDADWVRRKIPTDINAVMGVSDNMPLEEEDEL